MNRTTAKRLWEVIKAYGEGKTIQYKARDTGRWCDWIDSICSDCTFYDDVEYRIKPEDNLDKANRILEEELKRQHLENKDFVLDYNNKAEKMKEKHYRPFKNCDELIEYWYDFTGVINCSPKLFMPQIWVKHKRYGTESLITAFDNNNESIGANVIINDFGVTMKMLFDNYTFCDGSICGMEE